MASVSFPAAAADPSVIGPDDPAAGGESSSRVDTAFDGAAVDGAAVDETAVDEAATPRPDPDRSAVDAGPAGDDVVPASSTPQVSVPPEPASLTDEVVAVARAAAVDEAGRAELVGDYLGAVHEDDVAVAAAFAATDRGYLGWYWSVTLALVEPARPTISEVVLLPGEQALLAPPWVPWDQRIRAGDVGPGDLLPTAPDDIRLVPGYVDSDDPAIKEVEYEFGFGRPRVLSREGRDDAAQRWHDGPYGPDAPIAQAAPATCVTCGFFTPLSGLLGMSLGACANEFSPADGRVVDVEFGCGAHSQTVIDAPLISASTETVVDELTLEVHLRPVRPAAALAEPIATAADDSVAEDARHLAAELVAAEVIAAERDTVLRDEGWDQPVDVAWPSADEPTADQPEGGN